MNINSILEEFFLQYDKKKVELAKLESHVIETLQSRMRYQELGGYLVFAKSILLMLENNTLSAVKASKTTDRTPVLPTVCWVHRKIEPSWSKLQILKFSNLINLDGYEKHPEWQSEIEWRKIEKVYEFLRTSSSRPFLISEERSLELFGDEKWLSSKDGSQFLLRSRLTLRDLRAFEAREPFASWWNAAGTGGLILENKATFHTCIRLLMQQKSVCGMYPKLVIYGKGEQIISSLSFLESLMTEPIVIDYFGDADPTGWEIYTLSKDKFPQFNIRLAIPLYKKMLLNKNRAVRIETRQVEKPVVLEKILSELQSRNEPGMVDSVQWLWDNHLRVAQETNNYEWLLEDSDARDMGWVQ